MFMKEFNKLKIIQLIIVLLLTVVGLVIVFTDDELFQMIGFDTHVKVMCFILWLALGVSFIFIYLDYRLDSQLRRENEELNYAFYTDPDTGVANRNSCDAFIDQFQNRILPDGMAAFTIVISNLRELNSGFGYEKGDAVISDLAGILQGIVSKGDFLGRNGGDRFLIILRRCSKTEKDELISKINKAVDEYNEGTDEEEIMKISIGAALQVERHAMTMNNLVAASDRMSRGE